MIKNNYIMDEVIKWGIIGLGNVAHEFAKSFYNTKFEVTTDLFNFIDCGPSQLKKLAI